MTSEDVKYDSSAVQVETFQSAADQIDKDLKEAIDIAEKLLESVKHGDFSNGIQMHGVDEGVAVAAIYHSELEKRLTQLKEKYNG